MKLLNLSLISVFLISTASFAANLDKSMKGEISVDGSSTVFPISSAAAEEFKTEFPNIRVGVATSGTGGGFKKFCAGEIQISDASRPIKKEEMDACAAKNISFIELPIAYDGIAIVTNKANDWAKDITVDELKKVWDKGSTVKLWSDIRASWPKQTIKLYGPGQDSGTFDYFTQAVNGKERQSRADYTASENDNVLATGVKNDKYAMGYFGFAYYLENKDALNVISVSNGKAKAVIPSHETISSGTYSPLSRPIFIYISADAAKTPAVEAFVNFYLKNAGKLATEVGYISLGNSIYETVQARFAKLQTGTVFENHGSQVNVSLADILNKEKVSSGSKKN